MVGRNRITGEKINAASEFDLVRLAAFIDGEGCISIVRNKPRKPTQAPRHYLTVSVVNTNPLLISWLSEHFGGSVYQRKPEHKRLGKRLIWQWQMNGNYAYLVIARCFPYFICKKQQAEVGMAFWNVKSNPSRLKVSASLIAERDAVHKKMSDLNFAGGRTPAVM